MSARILSRGKAGGKLDHLLQWTKMAAKWSKYFPYPTRDKLIHHYLPSGGAASYVLFSTHLLNPHDTARLFPSNWYPIAMGIWCNAHVGIGLYHYHRPHLRRVKDGSRMIYTVWTTVLFNFGSVLFWTAVGNILPQPKWLRAAFGILTSVCFLTIGYEYLNYVDSLAKRSD